MARGSYNVRGFNTVGNRLVSASGGSLSRSQQATLQNLALTASRNPNVTYTGGTGRPSRATPDLNQFIITQPQPAPTPAPSAPPPPPQQPTYSAPAPTAPAAPTVASASTVNEVREEAKKAKGYQSTLLSKGSDPSRQRYRSKELESKLLSQKNSTETTKRTLLGSAG